MRIVTIADTHGMHDKVNVPDGDVLIHAGDFCSHGTMKDLEDFCAWLGVLPHKYKIIVAGNHDRIAQENFVFVNDAIDSAGGIYLEDEQAVIKGVKFYGSPWTPSFMNWHFMADRGKGIAAKWQNIPNDTDVLITHGPPAGILDNVNGLPCGCADLTERVHQIENLGWHVFGHIHEGYGMVETIFSPVFINASVCTDRYEPINKPIWFEI